MKFRLMEYINFHTGSMKAGKFYDNAGIEVAPRSCDLRELRPYSNRDDINLSDFNPLEYIPPWEDSDDIKGDFNRKPKAASSNDTAFPGTELDNSNSSEGEGSSFEGEGSSFEGEGSSSEGEGSSSEGEGSSSEGNNSSESLVCYRDTRTGRLYKKLSNGQFIPIE